MKKKLTIGVIFGGASGEHEVSIVSARSIIENLDGKKYHVVPLAISRTGQWLGPVISRQYLQTADVRLLKSYSAQHKNKTTIPGLAQLVAGPIDVAFPIIHGTGGEDGSLQGLLEMLNVPYVGSAVLGSAVGMDKVVQKQLVEHAGIAVTPYLELHRNDWATKRQQMVRQIKKTCGYPCFVKPANLGSSVGITKVKNQNDVSAALRLAFSYDTKVIVEKAVAHAHEFECAILGNDRPRASIVGEVVPSNEFYDYRAKYVSTDSKTLIPAPVPVAVRKAVQTMALHVFKVLNAKGMSRVDFLYNSATKKLYFNEINTAPGFTSISMYSKLWAKSGLPYPKLLDTLINLAQELYDQKKGLKTKINAPVWY